MALKFSVQTGQQQAFRSRPVQIREPSNNKLGNSTAGIVVSVGEEEEEEEETAFEFRCFEQSSLIILSCCFPRSVYTALLPKDITIKTGLLWQGIVKESGGRNTAMSIGVVRLRREKKKDEERERERQRLRSAWIDRVRLICIMRWLLWTTRQPISFVINVIPTRVGKEEEEEEEEEVQPKWKALFISFSSLSLRRVSRAGETRASLFSSLSPFCWHCEWLFHLKGKRDWVLLLSLNLSLGPIGKKSQMKNSICLISWGSTVCVYTQYDAGHTTTTAPKRL